MAFVLAAFYATLSGTTVTVQKQTNIASVVRWGVGQFTVTFATPMANTNYGVAADCRMPNNTGIDGPARRGDTGPTRPRRWTFIVSPTRGRLTR